MKKLETKLSETITARDDSKKAYGEAKKELDEVNKILKDEKKTMEMGQDEYNDLQIRKEKAEKELKTQKEIFEKSKTKIEDLKTKKVYNYDINESCKELCVPSEVRIIIKCLSEEGIMINWVIPYECDESKNS